MLGLAVVGARHLILQYAASQDGGIIVAVDKLSFPDAGKTVLQLRFGRMLLDTCDVTDLLAAEGANRLEVESSCSCVAGFNFCLWS